MLQIAVGKSLGHEWTCAEADEAKRLGEGLEKARIRLAHLADGPNMEYMNLKIEVIENRVRAIFQNALDTLDDGVPPPLSDRELQSKDLE